MDCDLKIEVSYRERVLGCWTGKCLGGAVGMPFEGVPGEVKIGRDDLLVQDVPNDDLELQLVWLAALKKYGLELDGARLAEFWLRDIRHGCDEYSMALRNLRHGIMPPASGYHDNFFADGMGAAIRTEIWALLFPGRTDAAAHFAALDASVDHWGDGVRAAVFMATAESLAFESRDIPAVVRQALRAVSPETRFHEAVSLVLRCYQEGMPKKQAARLVRERCHHHNFTDCVMNTAHAVFALLYGEGDFIDTIVTAVRFGRDTDCTAASCGALLGIMHGIDVIPEPWRKKVADRLTLSDFVEAMPDAPKTMSALVEETIALHERLSPELPRAAYPAYVPYEPASPPVQPNRWLLLDEAEHDTAAIKNELRRTGRCPENLRKFIIPAGELVMDLSAYAGGANTLNLFSFLSVDSPSGEVIVSATADTGMTVWFDDKRLLNHHSRQPMLPSFHRAEGGAAFHYPLRDGDRKLVHIRLYSCRAPLRCALMFGNLHNDHLDGFRLTI